MINHKVEQNSEEWYDLRRGIPTASMFSKLITTAGKRSTSMTDEINEKVANIIAGEVLETWAGNQWTERGHELEPLAVAHYEFITDTETQEAGFVTDDDITSGCSPDRLIGDDGLLEIKCPMPKVLIKYMRGGKLPTTYFQQVQGQLMVTGRKWCDFMVYHPKLPEFLIRVERDEEFITALKGEVEYFNSEVNKVVEEITNR